MARNTTSECARKTVQRSKITIDLFIIYPSTCTGNTLVLHYVEDCKAIQLINKQTSPLL